MTKNVINTFDIAKAVSYLGGLWAGISIFFGALIYWILYKNFWRKLTLKIIQLRNDKIAKQKAMND